MDADELGRLDGLAQVELVRAGEVSPRELVAAAIERMERLNPALNAIIHSQAGRALAQAEQVDKDAPLAGLPLAMKDIGGAEAGEPCHAGMQALKRVDHRESADSVLVQRLRAAGTVSIGRTNTPELALLPTTEPVAYGATKNPWSLQHSAGGSSGGAAAAVAAGIVPVAHASDGGGSIRGPASMCGLVGLKPSRARTSFGPQLGERWNGLSCELVVSRSVRDTAAVLDVVAGPAPGDPYTAVPPAAPYLQQMLHSPKGLRIGLLDQGTRGVGIDAEASTAVHLTARALLDLGHHVEPAYPAALDDPHHVGDYIRIVGSCTAQALDRYGEKLGAPLTAEDVEPLTWALAEVGRDLSAPDFVKTLNSVHAFGREVAEFFQRYDLLLTPTQGAPPPELGYMAMDDSEPLSPFMKAAPYGVFTLPFNLTGQPAINVPLHITESGLPMGTQLVGPMWGEAMLLQVARQLEEACPWSARWPA